MNLLRLPQQDNCFRWEGGIRNVIATRGKSTEIVAIIMIYKLKESSLRIILMVEIKRIKVNRMGGATLEIKKHQAFFYFDQLMN